MKKILFLLFPTFAALYVLSCGDGDMPCVTCNSSSSGKNKKSCDIEDYQSVEIGEQLWMAENLNCPMPGSKCYDDDPDNCDKYGSLYNFKTASVVCPQGWHIPTKDEWEKLVNYVENENECSGCAGEHLKSKKGWNGNGNGKDTHGFSAMPGGFYSTDFSNVGEQGSWWNEDLYGQTMGSSDGENREFHADDENSMFSVRCLHD